MAKKCVPMFHVPDVRATVEWYLGIGFEVTATYGDGRGGQSFAMLSFGSGEVMFSSGGRPSTARRREVDLYVYTEGVDELHRRLEGRLEGRVDVVEGPHDTFYGMRELIIRDLNRFWITFGEQSTAGLLMDGVREGQAEVVQAALQRGGLSSEQLATALEAASAGGRARPEIVRMLEDAGARPPPFVAVEVLQRYEGTYTADGGPGVRVTLRDGCLWAFQDDERPARLLPLDPKTFRVDGLLWATVAFEVKDQALGLVFRQGHNEMSLRRAASSP